MSRRRSAGRRRKESVTRNQGTAESPTSVAATVAWTLSVTAVLLCDVGTVVAQLIARALPGNRGAAMFRDLLLFSGVVVGLASLALLPVVYRIRRVPPPTGFVAFAACAAIAPLLALAVRALR